MLNDGIYEKYNHFLNSVKSDAATSLTLNFINNEKGDVLMSKEKPKVKLFERVNIADSDYAQKLYDKEKQWLKVVLICTAISAVATVSDMVMLHLGSEISGTIFEILVVTMWFVGMLAQFVAGKAIVPIKMIWTFIKLGYNIIPFILFDLLGAVAGLVVGAVIIIYLPVISCLYALYQSYRNLKDAEQFLALDKTMSKSSGVYETNI